MEDDSEFCQGPHEAQSMLMTQINNHILGESQYQPDGEGG